MQISEKDREQLQEKSRQLVEAIHTENKHKLYQLCQLSVREAMLKNSSEKTIREHLFLRFTYDPEYYQGEYSGIEIKANISPVTAWTNIELKNPFAIIGVHWIKEVSFMKPYVHGTWGYNPSSIHQFKKIEK